MSNQDDITGWVVVPEDDGFHEPTSHPWFVETSLVLDHAVAMFRYLANMLPSFSWR